MSHRCHGHGCGRSVPPRLFACRTCWGKLRAPLQRAILREYRPGQEEDKKPSLRYLVVQQRAIGEIAFRPHDETAARDAAPYLMRSEKLRALAIFKGFGDPLEGIAAPCRITAKPDPE